MHAVTTSWQERVSESAVTRPPAVNELRTFYFDWSVSAGAGLLLNTVHEAGGYKFKLVGIGTMELSDLKIEVDGVTMASGDLPRQLQLTVEFLEVPA
jgi:hypothetical protein